MCTGVLFLTAHFTPLRLLGPRRRRTVGSHARQTSRCARRRRALWAGSALCRLSCTTRSSWAVPAPTPPRHRHRQLWRWIRTRRAPWGPWRPSQPSTRAHEAAAARRHRRRGSRARTSTTTSGQLRRRARRSARAIGGARSAAGATALCHTLCDAVCTACRAPSALGARAATQSPSARLAPHWLASCVAFAALSLLPPVT